MSKEKAIEIVKNLTRTINQMGTKVIIRKSDNSIFHNPSASKKSLVKKKDELVKKHKLNKEDYAITNNEG